MQIESEPRRRAVPAVSRAAAILRLLARAPAPMGVNAVARELGLVPSTCLHILRVLVEEDLVRVDPANKTYALGPGLLSLARRFLQTDGFAERAQPLLDRLLREQGTTMLAVDVADGEHMTVLAMARQPRFLGLQVEVGSRFPALISATGRCFAAFGPSDPAALKGRFDALHWDRPPSFATWLEEVADARRDGHALDKGNYIDGVTILAVPVLDAGGSMRHALVALGMGQQAERIEQPALIDALKSAAGDLASG